MNIHTQETKFQKSNSVNIPDSFYNRVKTGVDKIDKVFGGGLIPGSVLTITGTPGVSKTTFLLTVLSLIDSDDCPTAYATGEESVQQLAFNCNRIGVTNIDIAHIKTVADIVDAMSKYKVIVIDSLQSLKQEKGMKKMEFLQYAQDTIISQAKEKGCVVFIVLHITTSGLPKGGTTIIHAVDVNIKMTVDPINNKHRIVDNYKNRFGSTGKHVFTLTPTGFDMTDSKEKEKVNIQKWIPLIGDMLQKQRNKKLKVIGSGLLMFDKYYAKLK
jgi:DNA repair protein RadA/Sms